MNIEAAIAKLDQIGNDPNPAYNALLPPDVTRRVGQHSTRSLALSLRDALRDKDLIHFVRTGEIIHTPGVDRTGLNRADQRQIIAAQFIDKGRVFGINLDFGVVPDEKTGGVIAAQALMLAKSNGAPAEPDTPKNPVLTAAALFLAAAAGVVVIVAARNR